MKYLPSLLASFFALSSLADTIVITQNGYDYLPFDAQVQVGDTVRWVWTNGTHDVASGAGCTEDGGFYGLLRESSPSFEYVIEESLAGQTLEYHCTVGNHCSRGMFAYLIVGDVNTPCPGDINGDQAVAFDDLLLLLASWGDIDSDKDVDGSGTVDFGDVLSALANWGPC